MAWDDREAYISLIISSITVIVISTILILILTYRWFKQGYIKFWTILLWLPYFILFIYITANLFPMTNPGEIPSPGMGLLLIPFILFFPAYVFAVNMAVIPLAHWTYRKKKAQGV
ncbi:hypothetical protein [Gracilibacillus alcaliphilus]|uniref:hypothetical protein n=1 Tax=Gracilibacillus alcaliphilus TaxID=1401441 RepID=UPI00195D4CA4|nr:hypothetical protein [Gracilibacillus alcaliphilus]MBM7676926.1 hypothetical protein [Gracilibacillus alcaliphilus]